jgi:hypothetical protein
MHKIVVLPFVSLPSLFGKIEELLGRTKRRLPFHYILII